MAKKATKKEIAMSKPKKLSLRRDVPEMEKEEEESKKCPFCQADLIELDYDNNVELKPDPNIMEAWYMAKSYEWFVKNLYLKI